LTGREDQREKEKPGPGWGHWENSKFEIRNPKSLARGARTLFSEHVGQDEQDLQDTEGFVPERSIAFILHVLSKSSNDWLHSMLGVIRDSNF
jgi:hypothetical protein